MAALGIMNADGSGDLVNLTNPEYWEVVDKSWNVYGPLCWSPDGGIFLASDAGSDFAAANNYLPITLKLEIYGVDISAGFVPWTFGGAPLTTTGFNMLGALSSDGTRIVFYSERDGNAEIYVMNSDGSGQTRLTSNPAQDGDPAW